MHGGRGQQLPNRQKPQRPVAVQGGTAGARSTRTLDGVPGAEATRRRSEINLLFVADANTW
jgi:hypothetical protein